MTKNEFIKYCEDSVEPGGKIKRVMRVDLDPALEAFVYQIHWPKDEDGDLAIDYRLAVIRSGRVVRDTSCLQDFPKAT